MLINLVVIVFLLLLNGFFVASEFALVGVRRTRIAQLSEEGNSTAQVAEGILKELDKFMAAVQLGITIASIGLGWVAESTLVKILMPCIAFFTNDNQTVIAHSIATPIAFLIVTVFHVVIGELMPKSIALRYPERTTLIVARPMHLVTMIFGPAIYVLNGFGNFLLSLMNIPPASQTSLVHSVEELNMIIDASYNEGVLDKSSKDMLQNVFKFSDLNAKQVMIPRTDMACIPINITLDELNKLTIEYQYTRYPVYDNNPDHIVGIFHVKDLYTVMAQKKEFEFKDILRTPMFIPETASMETLVRDFKKSHNNMAIVVDEFGGTSGIITLEDVLEEIFGEVQDEFDYEEEDVQTLTEHEFLVNAMMRLDEFNTYFDTDIDEEDVDTIGGYVVKELGRFAALSDKVSYKNFDLTVVGIEDKRITKINVVRNLPSEEDESGGE